MFFGEQSGWQLPRLAREDPANQSLKNLAITFLILKTNCQAVVFDAHNQLHDLRPGIPARYCESS